MIKGLNETIELSFLKKPVYAISFDSVQDDANLQKVVSDFFKQVYKTPNALQVCVLHIVHVQIYYYNMINICYFFYDAVNFFTMPPLIYIYIYIYQ